MRHGTNASYVVDQCRCEPCRTAARRYNKKLRLEKLQGIERLVDAQPLRDHVAMLTAAGMSPWSITIAAGWKSRNALASAVAADRVRPATLARVLSVSPAIDNRRDRYVDATASRRRLQALAVTGWPYRVLADHLQPIDPQTVNYIQSGHNTTIRAHTADRVAALYDQLWNVPGPSPRSSAIAAGKGWTPPMSWDDETIGDPQARPTGIAGKRISSKRRAEMVEDFMDTIGTHGGDTYAAADRLGINVDTLERALYRAQADGAVIPFARGRVVA